MTNREAFRRNLNHLLDRRGYKQIDLSEHLGISKATVSSWALGNAYPRADTLDRIAKFFGVSVFELVCEDDAQEEMLISAFRLLSPKGKEKALERMEELKQLYWYTKDE